MFGRKEPDASRGSPRSCIPQRALVPDDNSGWKSSVTFLLPNFPIRTDRLEHGFGGVVQPLSFLFVDMAEYEFAGRRGAEMDVGGFPSHGVEQAEFGVGGAQGGEFDAGAERTQAAHDPATAQLEEGIGTADGAVDDGLVEDFGWGVVPFRFKILRPVRGRRD